MNDQDYMRLAIDKAREGIESGQTPFGACIVKAGKVVSCSHNQVWLTTDITAHAEVQAIRAACIKLQTIDLSGCTIYSTCEPCPMCFSACHWARIGRIIYGVPMSVAEQGGFNELMIPNEDLKRQANLQVEIQDGVLYDENVALFDQWRAAHGSKKY